MILDDQEPKLFGKYIVGKAVPPSVIALYKKALVSENLKTSKVVLFAVKHPWSIRYLDSYTAFFQPDSEFRHRLFIMFALLECTPDFYNDFMPIKRGRFYMFIVAKSSIASIAKLCVGILLIRFIPE